MLNIHRNMLSHTHIHTKREAFLSADDSWKLIVINTQTNRHILEPSAPLLPCHRPQEPLKQQCVSYQLVNGVPTVSHTHTHTAPVSARVLGWVPLPKDTGRQTVPVSLCLRVCDMKGCMCDINTQSGSFEFAHKGRPSVCQSLSASATSLVSPHFTMAEPVCWNVDITNPMLCHLNLPLFQCFIPLFKM